jgi:hypothetical protein
MVFVWDNTRMEKIKYNGYYLEQLPSGAWMARNWYCHMGTGTLEEMKTVVDNQNRIDRESGYNPYLMEPLPPFLAKLRKGKSIDKGY